MNIKYKFNFNEKITDSFTPASLFVDDTVEWDGDTPMKPVGGLYPIPSDNYSVSTVFAKNIELINQRLGQITKQLTYWDLYKITTQVTAPNELDKVFAGLIPGQACVINCYSFENNGQSYHRGDIVVKMLDGEAAYIPAFETGYYYPSDLLKTAIKNDEQQPLTQYYYYYYEIPEGWIVLDPSDSSGITRLQSGYYISNIIFSDLTNHMTFVRRDPSIQKDIYKFNADVIFTTSTEQFTINPNVTLNFKYSKQPDKKEKAPESLISFKHPETSIENSFIYGQTVTITSGMTNYSFAEEIFKRLNTETQEWEYIHIKPIIKCYNDNHEEIDIHLKAILTPNQDENKPGTWTVDLSNKPSILTLLQIK